MRTAEVRGRDDTRPVCGTVASSPAGQSSLRRLYRAGAWWEVRLQMLGREGGQAYRALNVWVS